MQVSGVTTFSGVAGFSSHITLPDHAEIQVGNATGGDLRIYHNASDSYVEILDKVVYILRVLQLVLKMLLLMKQDYYLQKMVQYNSTMITHCVSKQLELV